MDGRNSKESMNEPLSTCDPRRIDQCLADSLSDEERAAFEAHLESCRRLPGKHRNRRGSTARLAIGSHVFEFQKQTNSEPASSNGRKAAEDRSVACLFRALAPTDDPRMLGRLGALEIPRRRGPRRDGRGAEKRSIPPGSLRGDQSIAPQLATSGAARQRFAREARAAASVVHENVVAIHAVADSGPLPYFVMPYLRRAALKTTRCPRSARGFPEILRVAMQIASGMATAHAQGLVHRGCPSRPTFCWRTASST